jgi:hypothetical protein
MKKLQNKIIHYKVTVEYQHLLFWPGIQGRFHCHATKLEMYQRLTIDNVPLVRAQCPYPRADI